MKPFVPREKVSKKQRRQMDRARCVTWAFTPVSRKVESKKLCARVKNSRPDIYSDGFCLPLVKKGGTYAVL